MNAFNAKSNASRTFFACAALIVSLTVLGSIDLLSRHYGNEAQVAAAATKSLQLAATNR